MNHILTDNLIILETEFGPRVHFHSITPYRITNQQKLLPNNIGYKNLIPLQFPGFEDIDIIKVYQNKTNFYFIDGNGQVYYINFVKDFSVDQIIHINTSFKVIDLTSCCLLSKDSVRYEHIVLLDENYNLLLYRRLGVKIQYIVNIPGIKQLCSAVTNYFVAMDFNKIYVCCFEKTKFKVRTLDVADKIVQLKTCNEYNDKTFYITYLTENGILYILNNNGHFQLTSGVKILSSDHKKCIIDKDNNLALLHFSSSCRELKRKVTTRNVGIENAILCTRSIIVNLDGELYNIFGKVYKNIEQPKRAYLPLNPKKLFKNPYNNQ